MLPTVRAGRASRMNSAAARVALRGRWLTVARRGSMAERLAPAYPFDCRRRSDSDAWLPREEVMAGFARAVP